MFPIEATKIKEKKITYLEFMVTSESHDGMYYKVTCENDRWECSCPHFQNKLKEKSENWTCKHIHACHEF